MPTKKNPETQAEQNARFRAEVERMVAAGELSPTDADERFESLLRKVGSEKSGRP